MSTLTKEQERQFAEIRKMNNERHKTVEELERKWLKDIPKDIPLDYIIWAIEKLFAEVLIDADDDDRNNILLISLISHEVYYLYDNIKRYGRL